MSTQPEEFDANDPVQLRAFDDELWQRLEKARTYYEQGAGTAEAILGMFAVSHTRLWELVVDKGGLAPDVRLKFATRQGRLVLVVRLVDAFGTQRSYDLDALELIDPVGHDRERA